jgi:beta-lactamase regulating signal transducer with metallopeptidase domain
MTAMFFNLLVNSAFSMACGLLVVGFFIWLFRVETGPWKLVLLSLPFVKIVYDSVRGLPPDSVLLSGLDPFSLPPKHQLLQIGAGFSYWGPKFNLIFSVRDTTGKEFAASVGDYLVIWLNRTFGTHVPLIILSAVLAVSATLLVIRIVAAYRFEQRRKLDRVLSVPLREEKLRFGTVDIYVSSVFSGTPFTGGLLKPYICIPKDAADRLNAQELEAVIAHELGHIRQIDLAVTIVVQLLGDLFWFVPGYRWLSRKIDRLREVVADQWAVRSGIEPALLASALVKLKEIPEIPDRFVLYSAFFRETSLLKTRVERLLGKTAEKCPRFGWSNIWFRSMISVWIFTAVMIATLGGNHQTVKLKNPEWFDSMLKSLSLEVIGLKE